MTYWPFWLGGLFLAAVPVLHWFVLRRMFAVSGRYSALTDWLRGHREPVAAMQEDELVRLLRAETAAAFGEQAVAAAPSEPTAPVAPAAPRGLSPHVVFLGGVVLGGTLSMWLATGAFPQPRWPGGTFTAFFGGSRAVELLVLFAGGLCVGFGTRMAGGCTSGHGLCGVSRLQPGSLVATACFFGMGIAASFALRALLGGGS